MTRSGSGGYALVEVMICSLLVSILACTAMLGLGASLSLSRTAERSYDRASAALSMYCELESGASLELDSYTAEWGAAASLQDDGLSQRVVVKFPPDGGKRAVTFKWNRSNMSMR